MIRAPKVGDSGEIVFQVEPRYAIDFAGNGMPAVLATPWLIWFMEKSAMKALAPLLEEGEHSVGVTVDMQHLAATPLNCQVTCRARVIHHEGRAVSFQVEARDEHEVIGRGLHKRQVIRIDRFAQMVAKKAAS